MMNSGKLRYSLLLILIFNISVSYSQDYIDKVIDFSKSEFHKDYQNEFSLEMRDVFKKINLTNQDLKFQKGDSLFIIRGIDIQNRTAFGRIWTDKFRFDYIDSKEWKNGKIIGPDVKISDNKEICYTKDFDSLIRLIEKGDYKTIIEVSEEHSVLSGVFWTIIRFYYKRGKIRYDFRIVQDFAIIDKE